MRRPDPGNRWSVGTFATSVTFGLVQMLELRLIKTAHSFKRVRAPNGLDRWRPGWSRCFSGKKLAHSCRHGPAPHRIKVCIPKTCNKEDWKAIEFALKAKGK